MMFSSSGVSWRNLHPSPWTSTPGAATPSRCAARAVTRGPGDAGPLRQLGRRPCGNARGLVTIGHGRTPPASLAGYRCGRCGHRSRVAFEPLESERSGVGRSRCPGPTGRTAANTRIFPHLGLAFDRMRSWGGNRLLVWADAYRLWDVCGWNGKCCAQRDGYTLCKEAYLSCARRPTPPPRRHHRTGRRERGIMGR